MRASRSLIAGVAVSLALLVAFPLVVAHVAGAAGAAATGSRARDRRRRRRRRVRDAAGRDRACRAAVAQPGDTDLAVSPSGRRLAFSSARTGNREMYVVDIATGAIERLTWTPRPRGRRARLVAGRLAGSSGRAGRSRITTSRRSGRPNAFRRLTSGPADDREPAWSPDGRTVAFASNEQGAFDLVVVPRARRCEDALLARRVRGGTRTRLASVRHPPRVHGHRRRERRRLGGGARRHVPSG